jgi:competence protein ComEA
MIILALAIVVSIVYLSLNKPETTTVEIQPPLPTSTGRPTATPAPIEVHVVGEVNDMVEGEGVLLSMPQGSRVVDAIEAAGGPTDNANLEVVNLAQLLQDGDRIEVPAKVSMNEESDGEESAANSEPVPSPTRNAPRIVNINESDLNELMTLPRIGETTAQRIIDYREANGPFETVEDLLNVEGIGDATLDNLRDLISVE